MTDPIAWSPSVPMPTGTTVLTGVVGDPIRHSLSPALFNAAYAAVGLDWVMLAFTVRAGGARALLEAARTLDVRGLSVTMPLKAEVAGLLDECTATASRLGVVNSVRLVDGRLLGDSTDGAGLLDALARGAGFEPTGKRCMVVGAGGAARAVVLALTGAGAAEVVVVNRTPARALEAAGLADGTGRVGSSEEATSMDLVVDATPAGMAGVTAGAPLVDAGLLGPGQLAVDLVYHPLETAWLAEARRRGAGAVGGLGMLVHQAAAQFAWWTGEPAPVEVMWDAAKRTFG